MTIGPDHPDHPGYQAPREDPDPRPDPAQPGGHQWPSYEQPQQPRPEPPRADQAAGQQPWAGQPAPPPYGQAPQPGYYAAAYSPPHVAPMHPRATTALTLGIVGLAGTFLCGFLVVLGPFAWSIGARAKREIAASGGGYRGASEANTGMILGIVTTVLLILAILAVVAFIVLVAAVDSSTDYSSYPDYSTS